jgi:hypothetical protein
MRGMGFKLKTQRRVFFCSCLRGSVGIVSNFISEAGLAGQKTARFSQKHHF